VSKLKTISIPPKSKHKSKPDPYYPAAVERVRDAVRRLQEAGILDSEGRRIRKDLPADMQEGRDRDFGG
jgi:hypothetical protein